MHILSKYKDYYDYLMGIYGVDEKIVLDRTKFDTPVLSGVVTFYICGKMFEGYVEPIENKLYLHDELYEKYKPKKEKESNWLRRYYEKRKKPTTNINRSVTIMIDGRYKTIYLDIVTDGLQTNKKHDCAIMCKIGEDLYRYPKLEGTGVGKLFPPKEMYLMLSEWLAPNDDITDNRTNEEKILSNGFDKKISFRNIK